jgi:hypothetical protein
MIKNTKVVEWRNIGEYLYEVRGKWKKEISKVGTVTGRIGFKLQ